MTYEEAKRILHPDTTREALAEIGFKGKEKLQEAVDEACLMPIVLAWEAVKVELENREPVVHCKDCLHYCECVCDYHAAAVCADWFCWGGEKRTDFVDDNKIGERKNDV